MRRFAVTIVLTVVLCGTTLAGEIPSGGFASPAPTDAGDSTTITAPGDVPSVGLTGTTVQEELLKGILGFVSLMTP